MWSCGVRSRGLGKTKAPEERKEEKWRIAERGELEKEDDWRTRRRYGGRGGVDEEEDWRTMVIRGRTISINIFLSTNVCDYIFAS